MWQVNAWLPCRYNACLQYPHPSGHFRRALGTNPFSAGSPRPAQRPKREWPRTVTAERSANGRPRESAGGTPASQCSAWTKCQSPSHQLRPAAKPRESNRPRQLRDLQDPEQRTTQTWRSTPKVPRVRSCTSQSSSRQPRASVWLPRGERSDLHFLWGLNVSVDRSNDSDENPLIRFQMFAYDF